MSTLYKLLNLCVTLLGKYYDYHHYVDEEMGVKRG